MSARSFTYLIIGGGLAGVSAIEGIRELDQTGKILLIGGEKHLPYDRPPLSKKLWTGKKTVDAIFLKKEEFYAGQDVVLALGRTAVSLDPKIRSVTDDSGAVYLYEKVLLATGGVPRELLIPGGELKEIFYFRTLDDYLKLKAEATPGSSAVIIGGGFIGSEMAAALNMNQVDVTMIFPDPWLVNRVFPESLGKALQRRFLERGVKILSPDKPVAITRQGKGFLTRTESGTQIPSDIVVAGVGIAPSLDLARRAGLQTANGIIVDEYLQASLPGIHAAGDNAFFPYTVLGKQMRVEHWDNSLNQGKQAGRNMAGAKERYDYMPYFFSDLYEFGYEAVGDVNTQLDIFEDWRKENEQGVIYYLRDGKVRGAMMCNVWDKVETARELIREGRPMTHEKLRGLIT
jgi:NAD(P)H-nitrite reductase large subunit